MVGSTDLGDVIHLFDCGFLNLWVSVTLVDRSISTHEVDVLLTLDIPHVDTLSLLHDSWIRSVILADVLLFTSDVGCVSIGNGE